MNLRKKVQTRKTRMAEKKKETSIKLPQHNKESPKIQDTLCMREMQPEVRKQEKPKRSCLQYSEENRM